MAEPMTKSQLYERLLEREGIQHAHATTSVAAEFVFAVLDIADCVVVPREDVGR